MKRGKTGIRIETHQRVVRFGYVEGSGESEFVLAADSVWLDVGGNGAGPGRAEHGDSSRRVRCGCRAYQVAVRTIVNCSKQ